MQKSGITSRNSSRLWPWVTSAGLILIAIGVLMPILGIGVPAFKWVYGAGAVVSLIGRIMTPYKGDILRVKRLHRIEAWSSIFFCVATFFMFYPGAGASDWLAFTLAGGCILLYTSIMIPRAAKSSHS